MGRFEKYLTAQNYVSQFSGRTLKATVMQIDDTANATITESQIRNFLVGQGHKLPWDNSGRRLGRSGPGIPGTRISSKSKAYKEGYRRWIGETLVKDQ